MQNHFLITLLTAVIFLALIGAATHACVMKGGPASEKMFRAARAFIIAGLFLLLTFFANYYLAAPALGRFLGREKLTKLGDVGRWMFAHSHMRSNDIFALALVSSSFIACAYLLKYIGLFFAAVQSRSWQTNTLSFAVLLLKLILIAAATCIFLWLDTEMLLFRSAMMMWSEEMSYSPANLPNPSLLIAKHQGSMGAYMLGILGSWYPLYILLAEKHFASCAARLSEASLAIGQARLRRQQGGAPTAPLPIIPVGAPGVQGTAAPVRPRVPVAPQPDPVRPTPFGPDAPAPGGAAPFIRPIPFNPGPQNGRRP